MSPAGALLGVVLIVGCATTLEREAQQAAVEGVDPAPMIDSLARQYARIGSTKRIFDVTLIEGRRRFSGEGAVEFHPDPHRLRVDVYGPHGTPILHVRLEGEDLVVTLPQEGEVLSGRLGDPKFAVLTGERALVSPEALGALLGAYHVRQLVDETAEVSAAREEGRSTLYVVRPDAVHAFTMSGAPDRLVEYREARDGRLIYRVRFEDFRPVGGGELPHHTVLRDYVQERQLVIDVTQERKLVPEGE